MPVVMRPSGASADMNMWVPSEDQVGQHCMPFGVTLRTLLPSARAVKTVSSWKLPPAFVKRIEPKRIRDGMTAGTWAELGVDAEPVTEDCEGPLSVGIGGDTVDELSLPQPEVAKTTNTTAGRTSLRKCVCAIATFHENGSFHVLLLAGRYALIRTAVTCAIRRTRADPSAGRGMSGQLCDGPTGGCCPAQGAPTPTFTRCVPALVVTSRSTHEGRST